MILAAARGLPQTGDPGPSDRASDYRLPRMIASRRGHADGDDPRPRGFAGNPIANRLFPALEIRVRGMAAVFKMALRSASRAQPSGARPRIHALATP